MTSESFRALPRPVFPKAHDDGCSNFSEVPEALSAFDPGLTTPSEKPAVLGYESSAGTCSGRSNAGWDLLGDGRSAFEIVAVAYP